MKDRFSGPSGMQKLIEIVASTPIVSGNTTMATALAEHGRLVEFAPGDTILEQNATDTDVFFIINGEVAVFVNHQQIAIRSHGEVVGEMVAVDSTSRRSATLTARTDVLVLRLSADDFTQAGEQSPRFWRYLAQLACNRLRQRAKFHLPANQTPILFLASSVEGLPVLDEIERGLGHDPVIVRAWRNRGVFGPSGIPIDELIAQVDQSDFGVFVFGPDDQVSSRGGDCMAPRDNIVFEMGLFIARLGRERVFMVKDEAVDLKIPTDLSGVNPITFKDKPGGQLSDVMGTVCTELRKAIEAKGVVSNRMRN